MGRAPGQGLGVPQGHDAVPTSAEGLRERGLVYRHLAGAQLRSMHVASMVARVAYEPTTLPKLRPQRQGNLTCSF